MSFEKVFLARLLWNTAVNFIFSRFFKGGGGWREQAPIYTLQPLQALQAGIEV